MEGRLNNHWYSILNKNGCFSFAIQFFLNHFFHNSHYAEFGFIIPASIRVYSGIGYKYTSNTFWKLLRMYKGVNLSQNPNTTRDIHQSLRAIAEFCGAICYGIERNCSKI